MDIAATSLLIAISLFAIMIDITNIYGDYGINEEHITLPTIILFCIQWTLVLLPLHYISQLPLRTHFPIKQKMLYFFILLISVSSIIIIISRISDIRDALLMDMIDIRHKHYGELIHGSDSKSSPLLIIPNILVTTPFPTLALFLWFYTKSFTTFSFYLRSGIFIASFVQAIVAITIAGRASIIYWIFDFYILYSFFYRYLSGAAKRSINISAGLIGLLAIILFMAITVSRFDTTSSSSTPLESLYGYAGQHLNNFCTMFVLGGNGELLFDRIFPYTSRFFGNPYDMVEHYDKLNVHIDALVNVFDTFGAEIYLDLGWIGYITFFILWIIMTTIIRHNWQEIPFYRIFYIIIIIAFFTRGLFAWPFPNYVSTIALILILTNTYFFKYIFKI